ncbi:MAG: AbrB/MazE/SpoVT family DNA-binding domain-containing protein [Myxococcota bacterium]
MIRMSTKVTERGQITISKPLRQKYGLSPGVEVEVVEENGQLVILKAPRSPVDRVYGIVRSDESSDDYIAAIRGK